MDNLYNLEQETNESLSLRKFKDTKIVVTIYKTEALTKLHKRVDLGIKILWKPQIDQTLVLWGCSRQGQRCDRIRGGNSIKKPKDL